MTKITVIGGIKAKIVANADSQLMAGEQNEGTIDVSFSGTGRNIAENLGRMGADTALVAAAGDDFAGRGAKAELEVLGVNTSNLQLVEGQNTAMNISVLNIIGDLEFAVDNTDVYQFVNKKQIDQVMERLNASNIVCVDGSLNEETLQYIAETVTVPLFLDPHTEEDAKKVKCFIGAFDTIKPNRGEAAAICGMEIFSEEQLMAAGQWFAAQGVRRTFITMSGGGVYYKEGSKEGILRPEEILSFANEEGAGDAFSAAILEGTVKGLDIEAIAVRGMKAASIALETKCAVNPQMSERRMSDE